MIVKFCFQDEIHRCSNPPMDFASLFPYLANMFHASLPTRFSLYYTVPDGGKVLLDAEEAYQGLQKLGNSKPVKITIEEAPEMQVKEDLNEYEVLNSNSELEKRQEILLLEDIEILDKKDQKESSEEREENKVQEGIKEVQMPHFDILDILTKDLRELPTEPKLPEVEGQMSQETQVDTLDRLVEKQVDVLDQLVENLTKLHVMPKIPQSEDRESQVRIIVKETLHEQMPYIVDQVKASLVREGLLNSLNNNAARPDQSEPRRIPSYNWRMGFPPNYNFHNYHQSLGIQADVPRIRSVKVYPEVVPSQSQESEVQKEEALYQGQAPQNVEKPGILDKIYKTFCEVTDKTAELANNFAQALTDPIVELPEGKYPKSVVDKTMKMMAVFPDENKKEVLDFVLSQPRTYFLDQLADVYMSIKGQ